MTREEQIEAIRKVIYKTMHRTNGVTSATDIATAVYDAGYCSEATLTYDFIKMVQRHAVKEFADKIKDYINNKVEDEYGDMSDSVNYITIDIDEFETFIDNLLEEQNGKDKD